MLHCAKCHHANTAQSNFCSNCGEALAQAASGDTTRIIPVIVDDSVARDLTEEDERTIGSLPEGSALLLVRRGQARGARFLIDSERTIAGRHPDSDIFLDDVTVSRHHVEFVRQDGELTVQDLGSLNGTYVNRELVDAPTPLRTGDEVQIGKFRMICFVSARGLG